MHYDTIAKIISLSPTKREVEVRTNSGATYKVRVPWYKLQDGFFKIGDDIKVKVVEQDQFAYYVYP